MQPIDIHRIREDKEDGVSFCCGLINVFAFYACCALIVGGVVLAVKAIR